jgi:leucyl-tRNA synthetase
VWNDAVASLLTLMAPMAPHIAEELWEASGREYSVHKQPWPKWDADLAADEMITLVVQVNGRLRDRIEVPASIDEETATETAQASDKVKAHTDGKTVAKVIYVPGKLVNIVAK